MLGKSKKFQKIFLTLIFQKDLEEVGIGAWASKQSRPLDSRKTLVKRVKDFEAKFHEDIPRPKHWGGFMLIPNEFEFWQDGDFRLHDRFILKPSKDRTLWKAKRYYP